MSAAGSHVFHSAVMPSAYWPVAWTHVGNKAWESALFLAQKQPLSIEVKVQVGSCHSLSRDVTWLLLGELAEVQGAVTEFSKPMEKLLCPRSLGPPFPVHLCVLLVNSA